MDRRNFLKQASLGAAGGVMVGAAAGKTQEEAEEIPKVYEVEAIDLAPGMPLGLVQLNFSARRGDEVLGTATAFGQDIPEAITILSDILRPGDPKAADWVLKTKGHLLATH